MIIEEVKDDIILTNDKNENFTITYSGCDLYWLMNNYTNDNLFKITSENKDFYSLLKKLYSKIEKYDDPKNPTIINGLFTWISEAEGILENANALTIKKEEDVFYIKFFRNPQNHSPIWSCYICFCLSGSKNQKIANAFSEMVLQYKNRKQNILSKKKNIQ